MRNKRGRSFDEAHYVHASFEYERPLAFQNDRVWRYAHVLVLLLYEQMDSTVINGVNVYVHVVIALA